ncbi:meiotic recombination protein W68 [Scaptodrosophila lebanonensis]|uniref:DNA topoisomerase (ATP-hydrolyzing) n=1 Tax=Drosophila lebanonensis TaxID=7225 RepID=A0A6J2TBE7_DROLE|nr:meiotic recombination protein W68 [Scaptodrosophila lebanonensis]XP_030372277.1 meiotic recombination protein W68 [Scaptodrosophila lebanonensis]
MSAEKSELLDKVEQIVLHLVKSLISQQDGTLKVPNLPITASDDGSPLYRNVAYKKSNSRHRFCLVVFVFAEVHRLLINGGSCTARGLYYRNVQLIRTQLHIVRAKIDVCRMLNSVPSHLGILSATKGLMAGDIKLFLGNGDILDCSVYCGPISLPSDLEIVEHIDTQAEFVLIVEKESVFQSLLDHNVFDTFGSKFILLTGKGYPDVSTRCIVHKLAVEYNLPSYILVDADPFGIDIMLVYQNGSQTLSFISNCISTPMIRWIGLHPSEIANLSKCAVSLSNSDNKKISDILGRSNISLGVQRELYTLQRLQLKAEIESVTEFLSIDYIPNKIKRNLYL